MADLTSSCRIKDSQDVDEEINNIHVQVDGGKDVLLWRQIMHQHLGIIYDEETEKNSPCPGQHKL